MNYKFMCLPTLGGLKRKLIPEKNKNPGPRECLTVFEFLLIKINSFIDVFLIYFSNVNWIFFLLWKIKHFMIVKNNLKQIICSYVIES